ncbi:MAG TPA: hypothetical protein VFM51_11800 [Solirubrobacterales bacterium]|nr:hypothetical protein [Solirubrobacterales bacterium]
MKWEGSSWEGYEPSEDARIRYALIVPRLLAPHPNRGAEGSLRPDQGLALAVLVRIHNLQSYLSELDDTPDFSELGQSSDWSWRFVGAFFERLEGDTTILLDVAKEAPDAPSRAAASVAAACALNDLARVDEALLLMEAAQEVGGYGPVDRAWLDVQQARFSREIGHLDQALSLANDVRSRLMAVEGDPTADAIDASAAALILALRFPDSPEFFAQALVAGDSVATWWRVQAISSSTGATVKREFEAWARDTRITIGGEDVPYNRMLAASLMTSHSGDQIGWANQTSAIAKDALLRLDRRADSDHVREGLTGLRRGGDEKALKVALVHLAQDGPAEAIRAAASEVELSRSTHTTAAADLTTFELSGDLLDSGTADRAVSELLSILAEPKQFSERTTPTFLLEVKLVETLAGVLPAAGDLRRRAVIERLREMAPVGEDNQLLAQAWANLLWSMPTAAWSQELAQELGSGADRHHTVLEQALLGIAVRHGGDDEARKRLLREAREGSPAALGELGSVVELSEEAAAEIIARLSERVRDRIAEATGRISHGGRDPAEALAVMNLWHPAMAEWDPLLELLRTEGMADSYMLRTLVALASSAERIPPSVARRLRPTITDLVSRTPLERSPFDSRADVRGPALDLAVAIGAIEDDRAAAIVLEWLAGDGAKRRWAAHVAYRLQRCEHIGMLSALTQDPDPAVRAAAAAALAALLPPGAGEDDPVARALQKAALDPGVEVSRGIAGSLAGAGRVGPIADRLRRQLSRSISASVRLLAVEEPNPQIAKESDLSPGGNPLMNPYRREEEEPETDRPQDDNPFSR